LIFKNYPLSNYPSGMPCCWECVSGIEKSRLMS
jgi:hypothetical protein